MFKGSMVALITPFDKAGKVCKESFDRLIKFHLEQKTNAIVVAGTTGESATLTEAEKLELFEQAVSLVGGKIPVIAGTAKESTESCIDLSKKALTLGVDGLLVMTPAYVKPTQKGLIRHYQAIAKAVDLPIILYNVPGRTACDMLPETVGELSNIDSIVGIKEASGISKRVQQILNVSANDLMF